MMVWQINMRPAPKNGVSARTAEGDAPELAARRCSGRHRDHSTRAAGLASRARYSPLRRQYHRKYDKQATPRCRGSPECPERCRHRADRSSAASGRRVDSCSRYWRPRVEPLSTGCLRRRFDLQALRHPTRIDPDGFADDSTPSARRPSRARMKALPRSQDGALLVERPLSEYQCATRADTMRRRLKGGWTQHTPISSSTFTYRSCQRISRRHPRTASSYHAD